MPSSTTIPDNESDTALRKMIDAYLCFGDVQIRAAGPSAIAVAHSRALEADRQLGPRNRRRFDKFITWSCYVPNEREDQELQEKWDDEDLREEIIWRKQDEADAREALAADGKKHEAEDVETLTSKMDSIVP